MSPLEAAIRAACKEMGVDPDCPHTGGWRNFAAVGKAAADAFVDALHPEIRAAVRHYLDKDPPPCAPS